MMYRYISNLFGYCTSEPDWETEPTMSVIDDVARGLVKVPQGGVYKRNWKECKKFRTLSQMVEAMNVKAQQV